MESSLRIIYSLIVFIIGIVLLSVLTVLLIYVNRQTHLSFERVNKGHEAIYTAEKILSDFKEAELLHAASGTAAADLSKAKGIRDNLQKLDSLCGDEASQKDMINNTRELLERRIKAWNEQAESNGTLSMANAIEQFSTFIRHVQKFEEDELNARKESAERHSVLPAIIGIGLSVFSILIFILAFYFTNLELKKSHHLNNELELKNLQLEQYTKELSTFTDITSHDMQEPLRKIELFISMIEEREKGSLSERGLQHFGKIKESVRRMRNLFFSILTFNLADQARNTKVDVDLNEVFQETLESLKVSIRDTNAVITSVPLPFVKGVRHQLVQLFQNIISNALKYKRPEVHPELVISYEIVEGKDTDVRELRKDVPYYKINFRDNGIGFDQQYVDKIFEIFQRQVRTESNSLGIGLSICRKIAQNHGGTMTAESAIGRGSLFCLYVPVG